MRPSETEPIGRGGRGYARARKGGGGVLNRGSIIRIGFRVPLTALRVPVYNSV